MLSEPGDLSTDLASKNFIETTEPYIVDTSDKVSKIDELVRNLEKYAPQDRSLPLCSDESINNNSSGYDQVDRERNEEMSRNESKKDKYKKI